MPILSPDALVADHDRLNSVMVGEAFAACNRAIRDVHLHDPAITKVGIIMGAPGSGKTTLAPQWDAEDVVLMEAVWETANRRLGFAQRVRQAGKTPVCIWVRAPLAVCRARNNARPVARRVPDEKLMRSWQAIEQFPPLAHAEGWASVEIVDGEGAAL